MQDLMNGTYTQTLESIRAISPIPEAVISTAEPLLTEQDPKRFYYALDGHLNVEGARRVAGAGSRQHMRTSSQSSNRRCTRRVR